jgi:hypothetical protein
MSGGGAWGQFTLNESQRVSLNGHGCAIVPL